MLKFIFENKKNLKILCLGAHSDDIEIGCGGTLLKFIDEQKIEKINWVVFSANETRYREAMNSANQFTKNVQDKTIEIKDFRDGFFPLTGTEIKEYFETLKKKINPDIIFTHYLSDRHQDHRFISDLTWNTFRDHLILEYEIPKYDGDLGNPNFYVPLNQEYIEIKNKIILDSFISQKKKHWFDYNSFDSLLRIRGIESNSQFAEAFYIRKAVF